MVAHQIRTDTLTSTFIYTHTNHFSTCEVMSSLSLETFKQKLTDEGGSGLLVTFWFLF